MPGERKRRGDPPSREPFIREGLRPPLLPERDRHPPLDPAASASAIRTRIHEVLGKVRESQLWIEPDSSAESFVDATFVPSADVDSAGLDGEAVLLNWQDGRYYTLNPMGSKVWELLDGEGSLAKTIAGVCDRFDVSPETARRDVVQLIREMLKAGLVVRKEGPA